jgi:hypothetical protein
MKRLVITLLITGWAVAAATAQSPPQETPVAGPQRSTGEGEAGSFCTNCMDRIHELTNLGEIPAHARNNSLLEVHLRAYTKLVEDWHTSDIRSEIMFHPDIQKGFSDYKQIIGKLAAAIAGVGTNPMDQQQFFLNRGSWLQTRFGVIERTSEVFYWQMKYMSGTDRMYSDLLAEKMQHWCRMMGQNQTYFTSNLVEYLGNGGLIIQTASKEK